MKTIITFGNNHLIQFNVRPLSVMLVIEAESENKARTLALNFNGIGEYFCTSYPYTKYEKEFKEKYNMKEYTFDDLEMLRIKEKVWKNLH